MQRYVANLAVTTSIFRAKGSAGAMQAAINFVSALDLSTVHDSASFDSFLDQQTVALQSTLPPAWRPWGPARKALNVFLRDASYNAYLRSAYDLAAIEAFLETQADSNIDKGLRRKVPNHNLPAWKGIMGLTPEANLSYQNVANVLAHRLGTLRAHLDLWLWRPTEC